MDDVISRMENKNYRFMPKLRKNRKLELRWGTDYYAALNEAVFVNQDTPYTPPEPPQAFKSDIDKTQILNACKQCGDSFRFKSSLEDHISRRSWILGFWCQQCFATRCTHTDTEETKCSSCIYIQASKNAYLVSKGIRKNIRKGVTKVFYNQCQFFNHLKMHGISQVDLSEVMLMPLPSGIRREHYAKLDKVCKALMEFMFVRRVHIMDWFKDKKINPQSWHTILDSNSENSKTIADILNRYAEDCTNGFDYSTGLRPDNPIQIDDSPRASKNVGSRANVSNSSLDTSDASHRTLDLSSSEAFEGDDDPCVPTDIAFVDCGPIPNTCAIDSPGTSSPNRYGVSAAKETHGEKNNPGLPEFPSVLVGKDASSAHQTIIRANSMWRSFSQQFDTVKDQSGTPKVAEKIGESSPSPVIGRTNPRILTIRSPKSVNLTSLIKLPADRKNNKKMIIIGKGSEGEKSTSSSSDSTQKKKQERPATSTLDSVDETISAVLARLAEESTEPKTPSPTKKAPSIVVSQKSKSVVPINAISQSFSEQMSLHGRIVFQNGRKYIIRHVPKTKTQAILPKSVVLTNFLSPPSLSTLVPISKTIQVSKPVPISPSVLLAKSNTINQVSKHVKIAPKIIPLSEVNLAAMKANLSSRNHTTKLSKAQNMIILKMRQVMLNELRGASRSRIDAFVNHLKGISAEYLKATGRESDTILTSNLEMIKCLEKIAGSVTTTGTAHEEFSANSDDIFAKFAKEWESKAKKTEALKKCETCSRKVKPPSYVIGLSGPAKDEKKFCQCYNYICYLCNGNQGSSEKLKAHVKWHKEEKPFMCPDCAIVFSSARELEVHVWSTCFHPIAQHIYGCGVCEVRGIPDMESLTNHFLTFHARRKIICSECKVEYTGHPPTYTDFTKHYVKHHPHVENISEPKRLYVCKLKQCIVRPDLFRAHLSDHIGVLEWIYYKCPFCSFVSHDFARNKLAIRQHLFENHSNRLQEVVKLENVAQILERIKMFPKYSALSVQSNATCVGEISNDSNTEICPTGPKIISARSITPASFEHASIDQTQQDDLRIPKILDVRSEAIADFEIEESNDSNLQIITVESIGLCRDGMSESPAIQSEASQESTGNESAQTNEEKLESIALQINNLSSIEDNIEGNDSFNFNEDISVSSQKSETSYSEESENSIDPMSRTEPPALAKIPSYLLESHDDSQKSEIDEKFQSATIESTTTKKKGWKRPWRIALNSPTSMETEPVVYNCHVCGELINTSWSVIKNHFNTRHANDYKISVVSPKIPRISRNISVSGNSTENSDREDSNGGKQKTEGLIIPVPKRKRRWGPKKYFEKPGSPSLGICVRPEPVQEIEGNFRCKKCDQLFKDIGVLREHIATSHRIKDQYLICLECGENFVVVPSLQMHLKALHGIQDPITYMSQNTGYAPDTLDDSEAREKATEPNQCYVCMAVFEDKAAVDKHIRVHGMAFLKRKRIEAQRALQNSAKKNDPLDNNSKPDNSDNKPKDAQNPKPETESGTLGKSETTEAS